MIYFGPYIVHFEIPANDVEKVKKFYVDLFGWKIEKIPNMEYNAVETVPMDKKGKLLRPGVNGGLYKRDNPQQQTLNYINVESVEEYSKKVADLVGQIVVKKTEIPGMGWFAIAVDPEGNVFGLFEMLPMP